jgi:hypothetical protein
MNSMDNVKTTETAAVPTYEFKIPVNTWGDKKTKLQNKYPQLSNTDLNFVEGQEVELVGRLRSKLNKSEADVQKLLTEI